MTFAASTASRRAANVCEAEACSTNFVSISRDGGGTGAGNEQDDFCLERPGRMDHDRAAPIGWTRRAPAFVEAQATSAQAERVATSAPPGRSPTLLRRAARTRLARRRVADDGRCPPRHPARGPSGTAPSGAPCFVCSAPSPSGGGAMTSPAKPPPVARPAAGRVHLRGRVRPGSRRRLLGVRRRGALDRSLEGCYFFYTWGVATTF